MEPTETTDAFPYLVCTVAFKNSDWAALYGNLSKAQRLWGMVVKFLTKTGETVRSRVIMYKEVVHMVILYCSESLVVMDEMPKVPEGFHHQVDWRITGISSHKFRGVGGGHW